VEREKWTAAIDLEDAYWTANWPNHYVTIPFRTTILLHTLKRKDTATI
jgi:hypothetical protein